MKLVPILLAFATAAAAIQPEALIRVNQAGYLTSDSKQALLMATAPVTNATFSIIAADGAVALTAAVQKNAGIWNKTYANIYLLDFSAVKMAGIYSLKVDGPASAVSPAFRIGTGAEIYGPLLQNALFFFQAQRDGPDVISSVLNRRPSHLADKSAFVYKVPEFEKRGARGELEKTGGPLDVSGGWADAGDYVKFVETTSYVTALMLAGARDYPAQMGAGGRADFAAEGRFGLDWLLKMWDANSKTLYVQVGIGDGLGNLKGDHDLWRLPEADDQLADSPGSPEFFIKHRPVFAAGPPGAPISPNLAGRLAAAFATGYQVFKTSDPDYARRLLLTAETIFDLAATYNVAELTSTFPRSFYAEDEWRDDMELGATELYLALAQGNPPANLPHPNAANYLRLATHWAREYLNSGTTDFLNLYDVSGLAHYELCRALDKSTATNDLEVSRVALLSNLKKRLDGAVKRSEKDPFGLGIRYGGGDLVPHAFGVALEAGFYDELTHSDTYAGLAHRHLDFVLGANAWGTSFIVGAGKVFPWHMQHQIANLGGSLDGTPPLLLGATVDGPSRGKSKAGDTPEGARPTPWPGGKDPFAPFNGNGVQYTDDVGSWATVEPANDYTISTALVFGRLSGR